VYFRRKREYRQQDINELLAAHNIQTNMLMPKQQALAGSDVKLNADPEDPAPFAAYLPLEIFDNTGTTRFVLLLSIILIPPVKWLRCWTRK
jgi:hypothetical protein